MINSGKRFLILHILITVLCVTLFAGLFNLIVINGKKYSEASNSKNTVNLLEKAPRGEIYDRYGKPLVTNRECYSVTLVKKTTDNAQLNAVIYKLIDVIESNGSSIDYTFPVSANVDKFTFEKNADKGKWFSDNKKRVHSSMSPREVVEKFADVYEIDDKYSIYDKRNIVAIRFDAELRGFSAISPYTVIEDADVNVVSEIKERGDEFLGVEITNNYVRQYVNGTMASHILGRVGKISAAEYDANKNNGYSYNDIIGKQGIEKSAEEYLRGEDGVRGSEPVGGDVGLIKEKAASPGANVVLTIDSKLQQATEASLEETITSIRETGYEKHGADADSGAAVVIDVRNGDVLACASYPTYDISTFSENYSQLSTDETKPLWNRAVSGTYAPGSTFKPLTAIAALETGVLGSNEKIHTEGVYSFYSDYRPKCWIWQDYKVTHGSINVSAALEQSCNYFFCEAGRRVGIDKLDEYAARFGLGKLTGVELYEETAGYVAGPEAKKKMVKNETEKSWYGGDTIQAAIGQSYNLLTPVQLANYAATIANGGTRYKVNLIKSVRSGTDRKEIRSSEPVIEEKIDMSPETIQAVKLGMKDVVDEGSASAIFSGYPIKIAGKTGTAQIGQKQSNNALFIAYAPYDNPEIAVAVVLEHGVKGANAAYVARDIFNSYFNIEE